MLLCCNTFTEEYLNGLNNRGINKGVILMFKIAFR